MHLNLQYLLSLLRVEFFQNFLLDTRDGIKAIGKNHFIHIRKSGTEPIIRIYVESDSPEKSRELCEIVKTMLGEINTFKDTDNNERNM